MLKKIKETQLKRKDLSDELIDFVNNWNFNLPIDRWWREKNKVNFNSHQHRSISLIDILIELEEFLTVSKIFKENINKELNQFKGKNKSLNLSKKEIEDFDNLDLSKL